jgi:hypothetical protein
VSAPTARGETSRCPQIHRASERFFAAVATYRRLEKAPLKADIHRHAGIASTFQPVSQYADGEDGRGRALWIPAIRRDTYRVGGEHAPPSQRLICEYFYVYIHLHPRLLHAPAADSATGHDWAALSDNLKEQQQQQQPCIWIPESKSEEYAPRSGTTINRTPEGP